MKVAVAGTGYVGLVTGVVLAEIGHNVTCVDVDEKKIQEMQKGISPIYEKGLEELMHKNKERIVYTTDYKMAYKDADIIFIAVGTPEKEDGSANLEYVYDVAEQIKNSITKDAVVVVKSTVPIGTNDEIEKRLNEDGNNKCYVVSNPEFLAQGTAVHDSLYASRIVVGTEDKKAGELMQKLYEPLTKEPYNVPYLETRRRSSELIKYASNDFLALKISYVNEIANLCEALGASVEEVTKGMGYDNRIGSKFLNAGIGYGGSCFPKDTKALHWLAKANGVELKTIKACIEVNKNQKIKLFEKFKDEMKGELEGIKVAVLGLAFKPGTDDLREAPSIDNVKLLLDFDAKVTVYDPVAMDNFKRLFAEKVDYANSIEEAIKGSDVVFIMTEWPEIVNFDLSKYEKLMAKPIVYDGRNCYKLNEIAKTKIKYISIGR